MDSQGDTEFTMREDVITFSDVLTHSAHNIKNYRKRHQELAKNSHRPTETTQPTNINNLIWSIEPAETTTNHDSHDKMKLNLDKLAMRRQSATAGNTRRRPTDLVKTQARTLYVGNNHQHPQTTKNRSLGRENRYRSIEKQHNKGPLKDKFIECWLNSLLVETCSGQKFDMTIENPALKKYQLDRNSLLSKGIKSTHLGRLYKSLFVYSIGFNDLLNEICNGSMNLRKSIWKVYAILLEYCAEGSFQMMIAEIERDKTQKVESLREQIEKRQWIIENNEEINEQKNAKIYKEIKYLKEANENLINQKEVLLEEFKQAEQAFNQEVSLRLKFQNRINEIHGVYTQIRIKHDRLLVDNDKNCKQLSMLRKRTQEQNTMITDLRLDNQKKEEELIKTKKALKYQTEMVGELEVKKSADATGAIALSNKIKDLQGVIAEKDRKIEQNEKNYLNLSRLFESQKKEHEEKSNQFATSLEENGRLHSTIYEQMKQLNELYSQTRDFGLSTNEIKAEGVIWKRKYDQTYSKLKEVEKQLADEEEAKERQRVSCETEKKHREQLESDLNICYDKIKQMRGAKNSIEDLLKTNMKKIEMVDEIIDDKDRQILRMNELVSKLETTNSDNTNIIKTYESKMQMMTDRANSEKEMFERKMKALREEKQKIQDLYCGFNNTKIELEMELDKYKGLYEKVHLQLKNQMFERKNLDVLYKQSLNVLDLENTHIKELNIEKSKLNEEIFSLNRKIKNLELICQERDRQYAKDKLFWDSQIQQMGATSREKRHYVHPMIFEDTAANFANASENYLNMKKRYETETQQLKSALADREHQIKVLKEEHEKKVKEMKINFAKVTEKKDNEIAYEQERRNHIASQNKELEESINKITTGKLRFTSEDEEKYLNRLQEKKVQIESLMEELEKAHDFNAKMKKTYSQTENKLLSKDEEVDKLSQAIQEAQKNLEVQTNKNNLLEKQLEEAKQRITQLLDVSQNLGPNDTERRNKSNERKVDSRESKRSNTKYENIHWKNAQEARDLSQDNSKRGDFARKYKGAYKYYNQ